MTADITDMDKARLDSLGKYAAWEREHAALGRVHVLDWAVQEITRLRAYVRELEGWQDKARDASVLINEHEQMRRRLEEKDVTPIRIEPQGLGIPDKVSQADLEWLIQQHKNDTDALQAEITRLQAQLETARDTDAMVLRFLSWKLPVDFSPDCGISFQSYAGEFGNPRHPDLPNWPVGTNLFNATQAKALFEYVTNPPKDE